MEDQKIKYKELSGNIKINAEDAAKTKTLRIAVMASSLDLQAEAELKG